MNKSQNIAKGGMMTAAAFVIMMLSGIFPTLSYTLAAAASVCVLLAVIETGHKNAWVVFAASALLTGLFVPEKDTAVLYIAMFGAYPIFKYYLEQKLTGSKLWAAKYAVFVVMLALVWAILTFLLHVPPEGGKWMAAALLVFCLIGFALYDRVLTIFATQYVLRFKNKL